MKSKLLTLGALALLSTLNPQLSAAPVGTAFSYQGRLNDGANPAQGIYDLQFALYDALSGGTQVGSSLTNTATSITNGYFTVTLDFGAVFTGNARWLEIGARTNGAGGFTSLAPRQALTPTPYALYATSAGMANTASTALTASSVAAANVTGTLGLSQLPGAVVTNNAAGVTLAGTFTGSGGALTNLTAANLTGTVPDARLSTNVALLNTNQAFTGSNRFAGVVTATNVANTFVGAFTGNAGGLTNLDATDLTGTLADARLSANVALLNTNQAFTGSNRFAGVVTATNVANTFVGTFTGNAGGLTNLDAADLTGALADARLSANVVLLNTNQAFTGSNRFAGVVTATNVANTFVGAFTGNAGGLTNLDAVDLSGTVPDARLSTNVALRSGGNTFGGNQIVASGNVGIGKTTPTTALDVNGTVTATSFAGNGGGITNVPGAVRWQIVAGTSQTAASNQGYLLTNIAQVTVTLPAAPALGDVFRLASASAGGWKIAQNSGQTILAGNIATRFPVWTARASTQPWESVASSADGARLVAAAYPGQLYTSTDSGATWTARASSTNWNSVASSADGTKLLATTFGGPLYTSSDSGQTWTPRASNQIWSSVASATDGAKLAAAVNGGQIYTSTPDTTTGTAGYLTGGNRAAIELQYIGSGQWMPLSYVGTILAY